MQQCRNKHLFYVCRSLIAQISRRHEATCSKSEPVTPKLEFIIPHSRSIIPKYSILNGTGHITNQNEIPSLPEEKLVKMYKDMITLKTMDQILFESQRQERISFYMTHRGEEAAQIGSAAALDPNDLVYGQYREAGVLLYRGHKMHQFIDQCLGNSRGSCKGIQMPIHHGSKELNYVTISSTVATQMPQAVGSAYAYKRSGNKKCVVCYFGDGGSSEGDAHAAFNFAATLQVPVIFFCRNNGYAISTPTKDQYYGDGVASRGYGYGMHTIRVDGHDIFAVYNATKAARQIAVEEMKPVLIEAMVLRFGPHSTSDDSSAYRSEQVMQREADKVDPIKRFRLYLCARGCWDDDKEEKWKQETLKTVLTELRQCEQLKHAPVTTMFEHVFDKMEPHLQQQKEEMMKHVRQNHDPTFLTLLSKYESSV